MVLFKNYAGFSRVLWLNCIYPAPFRMRSTIKTYFPGFYSRPLCCLTLSLSRFFVQFSRYKSLTHFDVRYETLTLVKISYPASMLSLVGPSGLEPPTLRLSVVRSSQLSYGPSSSHASHPSLPCIHESSLVPLRLLSNFKRFAGLKFV